MVARWVLCRWATVRAVNSNPNPDNKQLLIIPDASHCDLYDGGEGNYIPWDSLAEFFGKNL